MLIAFAMQENEGGRECKKGGSPSGGEGLNEGAGAGGGWSGLERVEEEGCVGCLPSWPRAAPGRAAAASQTL